MSNIKRHHIERYLEETADEYTEARHGVREAASRLEAQRKKLQDALRRFYKALTGRSLPIKNRSRQKRPNGRRNYE